jgi:hypothetical protein
MKKTHWKKLDNPNYLGAYSLMDGTKTEMNVTIKNVVTEEVKSDRGSESCKVAYFEDLDKPMILNTTNSLTIEKLTGSPYIQDWQGQRICLYIATIKAFGSEMDALRIKSFKGKSALDSNRFNKAVQAVKAGTFDKSELLTKYELTKDQINELTNI